MITLRQMSRRGARARTAVISSSAAALAILSIMPADAQSTPPVAPPAPYVACPPDNQPLVQIPEIVSDGQGHLRGTLTLGSGQQRIFLGNTDPTTGARWCLPQYTRQFSGGTVAAMYPGQPAPIPVPATGFPDPVPGPTLRAKLGDLVQLTFLNQIQLGPWWRSIDRGERGEGCDENPQVPYPGPDQFPDCFHGSSTGNIHFHGTHTNPNSTGDNVFIEVRPSPRRNNQPTVTAASVKTSFDQFFARCETELNKSVLSQWPTTWSDLPKAWTDEQQKLLKQYDADPTITRKLWPVDAAQIKAGAWPQFYIGAYPYCFRLPPYTAQTFPSGPAIPAAHGPNQARRTLQMGQAPGLHWYHAHKHGSTTINVANGMTGAFIIEGEGYDGKLDAFYGTGWMRRQPVLIFNQLGTVPNLFSGSGGQPPISVNGRLVPKLTMKPGEVKMFRMANTSSRAGVFFAGIAQGIPTTPPASVTWAPFTVKQIAQDGVQFHEQNYDASKDKTFLMASGNRVDLLIKAPDNATGQPQLYTAQVRNAVRAGQTRAGALNNLFVIEVASGPSVPDTDNTSKFISGTDYPKPPAFLDDITAEEVKATKTVTFATNLPAVAPPLNAPPYAVHTIDGKRFEGNIGQVVLLNTIEEWKIENRTTAVSSPGVIDHPFHIHINPFQITEVFSPTDTIPNPAGGNPLPKYVFYNTNLQPGQCYLDPNDPASWSAPSTPNSPSSWGPTCPPFKVPPKRIWWDVFPIPAGIAAVDQNGNKINGPDGQQIVAAGYFKMRSRFVDYTGTYVIHCHILAHEDRGMMTVVQVVPFTTPYSHR